MRAVIAQPTPISTSKVEFLLDMLPTIDLTERGYVSGEALLWVLKEGIKLPFPDAQNTPPRCPQLFESFQTLILSLDALVISRLMFPEDEPFATLISRTFGDLFSAAAREANVNKVIRA